MSKEEITASNFIAHLKKIKTVADKDKNMRFFKEVKSDFIGVKMGSLFELAKSFSAMPMEEIDKLLDSDYYEARMGAVSIMDFKARMKNCTPAQRKEIYDLYIHRHDRINTWDMVDRSAPHVIGQYLYDKSRVKLYSLAKSKNIYERRTAIVSTGYFIKNNDLTDTFNVAEILVHDKEEIVHKAVGSWIREAGKRDTKMLIQFLEKYAPTMPRIALRFAIEKLDKKEKDRYMTMAKDIINPKRKKTSG